MELNRLDTRRTKGETSRARLMTAAAELFARDGYHGTKISDIVAAAGLTQRAFYLYFDSKEALFTRLVGEFQDQLRLLANAGQAVTPLAAAEVPGQARLSLLALFTFLAHDPARTRIALLQAPNAPELEREIAQMIAANMRQNQAAGHVRKELNTTLTAECVTAMVAHLTLHRLLTGEMAAEILADAVAELVFYGILQGGHH
jgi:AcrR family transcriptional regulator